MTSIYVILFFLATVVQIVLAFQYRAQNANSLSSNGLLLSRKPVLNGQTCVNRHSIDTFNPFLNRLSITLLARRGGGGGGGRRGGGERGPPKRKLKDDVIEVNGRVIESLPSAMFRVEIEPSGQIVLATISGKIRKNYVRVIVGDRVTLELSAYDLTRGRITYRSK
mmetsp:Transcript_7877/g.13044  ORF Transcript_7877/g.13044 Transcript_7877/m.13044 type:complete len:166 (+) Transcript_7877:32-529(+)